MEQEKKEKKKRPIILWIIIGVLFLGNGVTLWLYLQEKNKVVEKEVVIKTVEVERSAIKSDLLALQDQYSSLQTNDKNLQQEIEEKKAYIAELLEQSEKHKGDASIINKLRKETETLRAIMRGYVVTIDSLNTLNKTLTAEKTYIAKQLNSEKDKTTLLSEEKENLQLVVQKAAILNCFNVQAIGVKFKSGGKKEVTTDKAKRAEKIKVSFTLGENKIARQGNRTVFVRIITPDGKEMTKNYDESYRFSFGKSSGYYAGKQDVNYANKEISAVTYCEGQGELVPGNYSIEVTCDGVVVGGTTLTLD